MPGSLLAKIANVVNLRLPSPSLYRLRRKHLRMNTDEARLLRKYPESLRDREKLASFFRKKLRERFFLSDLNRKEFYINLLTSLAGFDAILDDADLVHENKFQARGSEPFSFGDKIDWHLDFKTGTRWRPKFYSGIRAIGFTGEADVSVPWEVSRFYQAIWLGKAYWVSRSEAHTDKFKELVVDWVKENPAGYGVNWCMPQEAAIRGINITIGLLYFIGSTRIDDKFLIDILCSLFEHGVFIRYNLGRSRRDDDHYISSLVGLVYLGILFYDTESGKQWVEFARRELEREIVRRVYEDGTHIQKSMSYQRGAAEMLTASYVLLKLNGFSASSEFAGRLEKMLEFLTTATMRDGRAPNTGEADDNRLFRLKSRTDLNDHRDLLAVGASLFNRGDMKSAADGFSEMGLLLLGGEGFEKFSLVREEKDIRSEVYRHGGIAFMRTEKDFCSFDFGGIGVRRRSGEAHNDLLNLTISGKNRFIVDRGSYAGAPGNTIRDKLRSTYSHNTVIVDGTEQADVSPTRSTAEDRTRPELLNWHSSDEQDIIEAEHHAYERLAMPVIHRRGITFNKHQRTFRVEDSLIGKGMHFIELMFHFAPELHIVSLGRNFLALEGEEFALMKFQHPFTLEDWDHSPGSGVLQTARTARVRLEANLPLRIETFIFITSSEDDMNYLLNRIQSLGSAE